MTRLALRATRHREVREYGIAVVPWCRAGRLCLSPPRDAGGQDRGYRPANPEAAPLARSAGALAGPRPFRRGDPARRCGSVGRVLSAAARRSVVARERIKRRSLALALWADRALEELDHRLDIRLVAAGDAHR